MIANINCQTYGYKCLKLSYLANADSNVKITKPHLNDFKIHKCSQFDGIDITAASSFERF